MILHTQDASVKLLIGEPTAAKAWKKLGDNFEKRSNARVIELRKKLTGMTRGIYGAVFNPRESPVLSEDGLGLPPRSPQAQINKGVIRAEKFPAPLWVRTTVLYCVQPFGCLHTFDVDGS